MADQVPSLFTKIQKQYAFMPLIKIGVDLAIADFVGKSAARMLKLPASIKQFNIPTIAAFPAVSYITSTLMPNNVPALAASCT